MNLEELERLAKEASSGPWVYNNMFSDVVSDPRVVAYDITTNADGEYIAAANPKVILEMIEKIKDLERRIYILRYGVAPKGDEARTSSLHPPETIES